MAFIESHLPRLILEHDCLVIPGLGGFVCNDRPARFDEAAQELVPPRRAIQFNERLLHNDGVLAHAVAIAERLAYPEALAAVEQEAAAMREVLQRQRSVNLPHVGRLFIAASGATQFMAEAELERLLDGFGLQRIPLKPIVREAKEDPVVLPMATPVRWPRIAAAIAVPLLAGSVWWFSGSNDVSALSILPEWGLRSAPAAYAPKSVAPLAPLNVVSDYGEVMQMKESVRFDFAEGRLDPAGLRIAAVEKEVLEAAVPEFEAELNMASAAFALVAGAFAQERNAQSHVASLSEVGLQADIHRQGSLHFVTVGLFAEEDDARSALEAVRASGHEAVWMKRL